MFSLAKKFEESMKELEEIVAKLEKGDATLDESLEYFEKGIKLSKECKTMLDNAEKKVSILLSDGQGGMEKQEFTDEAE